MVRDRVHGARRADRRRGFASTEPGKDYFDGIYWAISTITTVGYGDELPTTVEAKIVAMTLMVVGIG